VTLEPSTLFIVEILLFHFGDFETIGELFVQFLSENFNPFLKFYDCGKFGFFKLGNVSEPPNVAYSMVIFIVTFLEITIVSLV
jgi:hypothetical protein